MPVEQAKAELRRKGFIVDVWSYDPATLAVYNRRWWNVARLRISDGFVSAMDVANV